MGAVETSARIDGLDAVRGGERSTALSIAFFAFTRCARCSSFHDRRILQRTRGPSPIQSELGELRSASAVAPADRRRSRPAPGSRSLPRRSSGSRGASRARSCPRAAGAPAGRGAKAIPPLPRRTPGRSRRRPGRRSRGRSRPRRARRRWSGTCRSRHESPDPRGGSGPVARRGSSSGITAARKRTGPRQRRARRSRPPPPWWPASPWRSSRPPARVPPRAPPWSGAAPRSRRRRGRWRAAP